MGVLIQKGMGQGEAVRRLQTLQNHLLPQVPLPTKWKELWDELDVVLKFTSGILIPIGAYYTWCTVRGVPPNEILTFSIDTYSQMVALYSLQKMHIQLKENLGVSRTLTRSFQLLSFIGAIMQTGSQLEGIRKPSGQTNLLFHLLKTSVYGYFLYLTILYNYDLPDPRYARKMRGVVHWKSLFGYMIVMTLAVYVWIKESLASLSTGNRYSTLAMLGFMLTSFGIVRGGFKAATTSIPVISPFEAVAPLACATILNTLTKLPHVATSPLMRTYVAGYFAVSYCLVMIGYLALKAEKRKLTDQQIHSGMYPKFES